MKPKLVRVNKISFLSLSLTILIFSGGAWGGAKTNQSKKQPLTDRQFQTLNPILYNPNIFVKLAKKVIPSVVNISIQAESTGAPHHSSSDIFKRYLEEFYGYRFNHNSQRPSPFTQKPVKALGTGVVVKLQNNKAIILTNYHVIAKATHIQVQFNKETTGIKSHQEAQIIGQDPDLDLALIEIPIKKEWSIKPLPFGDSDALSVGEYVMAVGNPFGQGHSVSHGIISAKGREAPIIGKYLQTDTPINPGNSGGPLVNLKGEIIGINNAILAKAQGIGFAIPSNSIQKVLSELQEKGKIDRGYIGVLMGTVNPNIAAFSGESIKVGQPFVMQVEKNSPAQKGGLRPNDIIVSASNKIVNSPSDLKNIIASNPIGKKIKLKVIRKGQSKILHLKIGPKKISS